MNVFFYTCLYKILLLHVFTAFCMNGIRYNVNNRKIMITIIRFFKKKNYLKRKKKYHHQFIKFFKEFIFLINLIVLLGFKIVFDAVNFSALKREFSSMQRNSRHWGELQSTNYLGSKMDYQSKLSECLNQLPVISRQWFAGDDVVLGSQQIPETLFLWYKISSNYENICEILACLDMFVLNSNNNAMLANFRYKVMYFRIFL